MSFFDIENSHVLIIDDDDFMIDLIEMSLISIGFVNIYKARSGVQALSLFDDSKIDEFNLILCDLNMPEMDGIEFLRHLAKKSFHGVVILLSGENNRLIQVSKNLALSHGLEVLAGLEKPLDVNQLISLLEDYQPNTIQSNMENYKQITVKDSDIIDGIEANEFYMVYQPKVYFSTLQLYGFESLMRWNHPRLGMISPEIFIHAAEQSNVIQKLTLYGIQSVLASANAIFSKYPSITLSINVSPILFKDLNFPELLESLVKKNGLKNSQFVLEITETALFEDLQRAKEVITRLSLKRFLISIDDFGTGFASMEHLKHFSFDELKIDKSFAQEAKENSAAMAILKSSLHLAKDLKLKSVVEGIEDEGTWNLLRDLGCDLAQGYYTSKPLKIDEIDVWYQRWLNH